MTEHNNEQARRIRIEPYWIIIAIFLIAVSVLYIYHLASGSTPDRVALHIEAFDFDIYWYGVIIVAGISLGAYVTSRLASERAVKAFNLDVPEQVKEKTLSILGLPEEIDSRLKKGGFESVGDVLFQWGLNPQLLGLKKEQREIVQEHLREQDEIDEQWLIDAPWRQWNPDYVWSGIVWALVFAIIGARLYHVLTPSPSMSEIGINSALDYFRNPLELINLRSGGLGIYGAVIGGLLGIIIFTWRQRISAFAWSDLAVVGLSLGQVFGRWGNFFNQELYGRPTDLPWAVHIDPLHRLAGYTSFERFHPAFLYASLWNLLTFLILIYLARRRSDRLFTGDLTAIYFLLFAIGRILLELVRLDSRPFVIGDLDFGLPVATVVSIAIVLIMLGILLWRHVIRRDKALVSGDD